MQRGIRGYGEVPASWQAPGKSTSETPEEQGGWLGGCLTQATRAGGFRGGGGSMLESPLLGYQERQNVL